MTPIFFLSDFGHEDPYVGIVKAVIQGINPHSRITDLGHEIPPQDLRRGAYSLFESYAYLPDDSVVLAVIDPGVGSQRRAIAVQGRHWYVGPDNGLFSLLYTWDPPMRAFSLENPRFHLPKSATFHARDIFGPVAAHLANGLNPTELGPPLDLGSLVRLPLELHHGPEGEILTFDRFGNAITTLQSPLVSNRSVTVLRYRLPILRSFSDVPKGAALAYINSSGLLEIGVNNGSAKTQLGLFSGLKITID